MTEHTPPPVTDKRARYFDGQYLQDQDFIIEQNYQRDREHRHTRELHGSGVAEGLTVTSATSYQVTVAPGTAIDSNGYQLVLAQATTVDLTSLTAPQQGIMLYISYRAAATDPQNGEAGLETRWQETPRLTPVPPGATYPPDASYSQDNPDDPGTAPPPVLLAQLDLASGGSVTVDTSERSYAGLHVPGTLTVDGSIGVGTPTPGSAVELAPGNALRIDGGKASDAAAYLSLGQYGAFSIDAPGVPGGRLIVLDSGHVGIGAALPENSEQWNKVVDVLGSGSVKLSVRTGTVDARVQASDAGLGGWPAGMVIGTKTAHPLSFSTGGTPRITIDSGGNVGIATASAHGGLTVGSDGTVAIATASSGGGLTVGSGGNVGIGGPSATGSALALAQGKVLRIEGGYGPEDQTAYLSLGSGGLFSIDAPFQPGGRLVVLGNGNVGIGAPVPNAKLEVNGDVLVDGNAFIRGALVIWSYKPNANSDFNSKWYSVNNGNVWGDGRGYMGAYDWTGSVPSDIRLKTGLRPISQALDLVRKLRGVRYQWGDAGLSHLTRDIENRVCAGPGATEEQNRQVVAQQRREALDALAGDQVGLVAQDVEAVLPELVSEDDDGYKHVSYQHLTAVLIEAIKEQDAAVRRLTATVAALQAGQPGPAA